MPIKFRCHHCQQMLGISRSRAGAIVDCPGCGRTLRVPNTDGTTDPLPADHSTDTDRESLINALTELSALADAPTTSADRRADSVRIVPLSALRTPERTSDKISDTEPRRYTAGSSQVIDAVEVYSAANAHEQRKFRSAIILPTAILIAFVLGFVTGVLLAPAVSSFLNQ